MQNLTQENESRMLKVRNKRLRAVRSFASLLGIQGFYPFATLFVVVLSSYPRNQFLSAFFILNLLNASILWILLVWGVWTCKRWAYWVTLLVEVVLLLQGASSLALPKSLPFINGEVFLAPLCILYLLGNRNVRAAFFSQNGIHL